MAFFNYAKKELSAKIVYYGPGLSGKTTNLEVIHRRMRPDQRGKLISLDTQTDRTLFFDFLPLELGEIRGFKTRFHIYTVPGQVFYNATRKVVLKGVDGIVFVADTQRDMLDSNIMSIKNLEANLEEQGRDLMSIPIVLQYNKRDLPDISSIDELQKNLGHLNAPHFEASAISEKGVLETLTAVCKLVLKDLRETHEGPAKRLPKRPGATVAQPAAPPPPPQSMHTPRVPFGAPPPLPTPPPRVVAPEAPPAPPRGTASARGQPQRATPPQANPMLEEITELQRRPQPAPARPATPAPPSKPDRFEKEEEEIEVVEGFGADESSDVVFIEEGESLQADRVEDKLGGRETPGRAKTSPAREKSMSEIGQRAEGPPGQDGSSVPEPSAPFHAEGGMPRGTAEPKEEPPQGEPRFGALEPDLIGEPVAESPAGWQAEAEEEAGPASGRAAPGPEEAEPAAGEPGAPGLEAGTGPETASWGADARLEITGWGDPARVSSTSIKIPITVSAGSSGQEIGIDIVIDVRSVLRRSGGSEGGTQH